MSTTAAPFVTLCYPTYKRPGRVRRLIEYYSQYSNPDFEVLISNNDPDSPLARQFPRAPGNIRLIESPYKPHRIGNNIHNCLIATRTAYSILISDEDIIIGVEELANSLKKHQPDIVSMKHIEDRNVCRSRPKSESFSQFIFNNHGNLSGIGFKKSALEHVDLEWLLSLENNDYYHILLIILLVDREATFRFVDESVIYREVLMYENDFFQRRREWFFIAGRLAQDRSFATAARGLQNKALRDYINAICIDALPEAVSSSYQHYGFAPTIKYLLRAGELHLLARGSMFYAKSLLKRSIISAGKWLLQ